MQTSDQTEKDTRDQELVDSILSGGCNSGSEKKRRSRRKPGAFSDPMRFSQLDRRSREYQAMEEVARHLVAHFDGAPSFPEQLLIQSTCRVWLQLELLHAHLVSLGSEPNDRALQSFNSLTRSLRANLESLGLKAPEAPAASLSEYVAAIEGQRE